MSAFSLLNWFGKTISLGARSGKFWEAWGGASNWAGEPMNADKAMQLSTVWKCIRLISSTIGSLPFGLVAADGSGREGREVPLDTVIRTQPNQDQTGLTFWESMVGCMELVGNGFARKHFTGTGPSRQVIGLTLLNPWGMQWRRDTNNRLVWIYNDDKGHQIELQQEDVFQLKQFSFDGVMGLSTVQYGAQTLGSARAADRTSAEMFASGMTSSGFLETAQQLQPEDRARLQQIMDEYRGRGGVGRLMILEAGMKFTQMSMSAQDAQLLTSRQWNVEEICRWFDMPPILAGHSSNGTTSWGSGIEQIMLGWYILGLRNRIRRIEAEVYKQLMTPAQKVLWVPKFNMDALLQGDSASRANLINSYLQNGVMNPNEARALLNMPSYDGGEIYARQVNLVPAGQLGDNASAEDEQARMALRRLLRINDAPAPLQIEHKP